MRLLLDENLRKRLKKDFSEHEIFTVRDQGWNGIKKGELLKLMIQHSFDALLRFDKNLQHQQNFEKYPIVVFLLSSISNTYQELTKLSFKVEEQIKMSPLPGAYIIKRK